jgi:putative hydrolase of the HAD superfamily
MIRAIIFDFGFTLFHFSEASLKKYMDCYRRGLHKAVEVLKVMGVLEKKPEVQKFIGKFNSLRTKYFKESMNRTNQEYPTSIIFEEVFNSMEIKNINKDIFKQLSSIYHSCEAEEWKPFKNTKETLETLSKKPELKLAVLSNHPHHDTIKKLIEKHNLMHYFDKVITSALFGKRKPNTEIFNYTIKKLGLKTEQRKDIIMCGDEYADIMGAYRAGLQIILFERKYKFPYEKKIPLQNIIKIQDISEILKLV